MEVEMRKESALGDSSGTIICKDLNIKAEELRSETMLSVITLLVIAKKLRVAKMGNQARERVSQGHG